VFLSKPQTPEDITATLAWKDVVFAAWGDKSGQNTGVWVFKRGRRIAELEITHETTGRIQQLTILGPWIIGCCDDILHIWKIGSFEYHTTLTPLRSQVKGSATLSGCVCAMPSFLNKILVGRTDGNLEIWNVNTGWVPIF
jgi:U3 small nucleolar RNA-associated protein 21